MKVIPNSGLDPATQSGDCGASSGEETKDWSASLILLMVVNTSITVFYLGFWLLGWWIPALRDFFDDADQMARLFWPTVWFISFFISSFLSIRPWIKKPALSILVSLGPAFGFTCLLEILIAVTHLLSAPFFDPMF